MPHKFQGAECDQTSGVGEMQLNTLGKTCGSSNIPIKEDVPVCS
jgi:hypothetical protein